MAASRLQYDPTRPITVSNWPSGLRMPPLRRKDPKQSGKKPVAPATTSEKPPLWDFGDLD